MRTIRIKLYKFSELSKEAKQIAIEHFREIETFDYIHEEAWDSVKKFINEFNITIRDFDFLDTYRSRYTFESEDSVLALDGIRLRTYLINNYYHLLYECKPYGKYEKRSNGKYRYDRYSKCQFIETCCPFTGVTWDEDLLQPIKDFIKKPNNNDFKDLLQDCLSQVCKSVEGEIKALSEDKAIAENIKSNEYEFTKDGKLA